jgi:hypothetical protein
MTDELDPLPGFLAAALSAAAATGLYFYFARPLSGAGAIMVSAENVMLAGFAFIAALFVAALHIAILAGPLYALLSRGRPPGPVAVLVSATLIGALPMPVLFQGGSQDFVLFGAAGLIGGIAFLAVGWRPGGAGEDV